MDEMMKMLGKHSKADGAMSEQEKRAKMEVLKELFDMAHEAMGHSVKSGMDEMHKVSVMAPDKESLAEGLEMAEDVVDPEMEHEEEVEHKDLDGDLEVGEPEEHAAEVMGNPDESEDSPFAKKAMAMNKEKEGPKKKKGLFSMED